MDVKSPNLITAVPLRVLSFWCSLFFLVPLVDAADTIYLIKTDTVYEKKEGTNSRKTTYNYTFHGSTLAIQTKEVLTPSVSSSKNGPGGSFKTTAFINQFGRPTWTRDQDGFINLTFYDIFTGGVTQTIADVDTNQITGEPGGWVTPAEGGRHLTTVMSVDSLGRPTQITDPTGSETYMRYNDATRDYRIYPAWNASSIGDPLVAGNRPPFIVRRSDWTANTQETLVVDSGAFGTGAPSGTENINNHIKAKTFEQLDTNFRVDYRRDYHMNGSNTYDLTDFSYDARGRLELTKSPDGTYTRSVFDFQGRLIETKTGTTSSTPYRTSYRIYDNGYDGGNGLLTSLYMYGEGVNYETKYYYGPYERLVKVAKPDNTSVEVDLDWLGRITEQRVKGGGSLGARVSIAYDERGMPYQRSTYEVLNGASGAYQIDRFWYNGRGKIIKQRLPSGMIIKNRYDGLGRMTRISQSQDHSTGEWSYNAARNLDGDRVIEQSNAFYNDAGDRVLTTTFNRWHNASDSLVGPLHALNSFHSSQVWWYDAAHRMVGTTDYGRDASALIFSGSNWRMIGDMPKEAVPGSGRPRQPNTNGNYRSSKFEYDDIGRLWQTTDNDGKRMRHYYDGLGQIVKVIDSYSNGSVSVGEYTTDIITEMGYSGGRLAWRKAYNSTPTGVAQQLTTYSFNSPFNKSYVTGVTFPDGGTTATTYDRMGRIVTVRDQRQVVRTMRYNSYAQLQEEEVTTYPAAVYDQINDALHPRITKITFGYDYMARQNLVATYAGATQVSSVSTEYGKNSAVEYVRQKFLGNEKAVDYKYASSATSGEVEWRRLTEIQYPSNNGVTFQYDGGFVGGAVQRVSSVQKKTGGLSYSYAGNLAKYAYVGSHLVVEHSATLQTYHDAGQSTELGYSLASNNYGAINNFGQVKSRSWALGSTVVDGVVSTSFDAVGNITYRKRHWAAPWGDAEQYNYDAVHRLAGMKRGTGLGSGETPVVNWHRIWNYDSLGNWYYHVLSDHQHVPSSYSQNRAHNSANEIDTDNSDGNGTGNAITTVGPIQWRQVAYDAAGNLIQGPHPNDPSRLQFYVYDAWNRLVQVHAEDLASPGYKGTVIEAYAYDGLGRRVSRRVTEAGGQEATYRSIYSTGWQELERYSNLVPSGDPQTFYWDVHDPDQLLATFFAGESTGGGVKYHIAPELAMDGNPAELPAGIYDQNVSLGSVEYLRSSVVQKTKVLPHGSLTVEAKQTVSLLPGFEAKVGSSVALRVNTQSVSANLAGLLFSYDTSSNVTGTYGIRPASNEVSDTVANIKLIERYRYDAYGKRAVYRALDWGDFTKNSVMEPAIGALVDRGFGYGVLSPQTGLLLMRARFFDPGLGRWTSRDPIGYDDGMNMYAYVHGDPIRGIDRMGLSDEKDKAKEKDVMLNNGKSLSEVVPKRKKLKATAWNSGAILLHVNKLKRARGVVEDTLLDLDIDALDKSLSVSPLGEDVVFPTGRDEGLLRGAIKVLNKRIRIGEERHAAAVEAWEKQRQAALGNVANPILQMALEMSLGMGVLLGGIRAGDKNGPNRGPTAGGGADLDRALSQMSPDEARRIQNAADRIGEPIHLVGSRSGGPKTPRPDSDWDFVIEANNPTRSSAARSLPGAKSVRDNAGWNQDVFKGPLDPNRPHVTFQPNGSN